MPLVPHMSSYGASLNTGYNLTFITKVIFQAKYAIVCKHCTSFAEAYDLPLNEKCFLLPIYGIFKNVVSIYS
jgi:hypothetical protein